MSPPPGAYTLDDFPEPLARAFEAAFGPSQQATRPTAAQWVSLLEEYEQSLRVVRDGKAASLFKRGDELPLVPDGGPTWESSSSFQAIEAYTGPVPEFDPGSGGFDLAKLWSQIDGHQNSGPVAAYARRCHRQPRNQALRREPQSSSGRVTRSPRMPRLWWRAWFSISVPEFWLVSLGLVIVGFVLRSQEVDVASSLRQRYVTTESQWDTALEDWERRCGIDRIEGLKESLVEAKRSFEGLAAEEREKVSKYQADRR